MFAMHDKLVLRFAAKMFIYNQPTFLVMLFLKVISYYLTKAVPTDLDLSKHVHHLPLILAIWASLSKKKYIFDYFSISTYQVKFSHTLGHQVARVEIPKV